MSSAKSSSRSEGASAAGRATVVISAIIDEGASAAGRTTGVASAIGEGAIAAGPETSIDAATDEGGSAAGPATVEGSAREPSASAWAEGSSSVGSAKVTLVDPRWCIFPWCFDGRVGGIADRVDKGGWVLYEMYRPVDRYFDHAMYHESTGSTVGRDLYTPWQEVGDLPPWRRRQCR